jgi:hypothetical protein
MPVDRRGAIKQCRIPSSAIGPLVVASLVGFGDGEDHFVDGPAGLG